MNTSRSNLTEIWKLRLIALVMINGKSISVSWYPLGLSVSRNINLGPLGLQFIHWVIKIILAVIIGKL